MEKTSEKAKALYEQSIYFWQRMGIQREDNCMALSMIDVVNAKVAGWESYDIDYYIERGKELLKELKDKKYDINRGHTEWLNGKGF